MNGSRVVIRRHYSRQSSSSHQSGALIPIKCKKLISYQFTTPCKSDHVTHPKQHKSFFFWDNVIERSHCTYNPLDMTPTRCDVNVSLHSKLVTL